MRTLRRIRERWSKLNPFPDRFTWDEPAARPNGDPPKKSGLPT